MKNRMRQEHVTEAEEERVFGEMEETAEERIPTPTALKAASAAEGEAEEVLSLLPALAKCPLSHWTPPAATVETDIQTA